MKKGLRMQKVVFLALCLVGLLASGKMFAAEQAVTVQQYGFEASVVCPDGRTVDAGRLSLKVPLANGDISFSPPSPRYDRFSIDWAIRNICVADPTASVRFDVRNIDEAGFILKGESVSEARDGPGFFTKIVGDVAEIPLLGKNATLRVRRTAGARDVYPNASAAINAISASNTAAN